mgnify:CR=1 FL=1
MLSLCPVSLAEANAFVAEHHRHHKPVRGHKFSLGCMANGRLAGVAIVLIAPVNQLDPLNLSLLIVPTLAACLLGGSRSFVTVTAAAFAIGMATRIGIMSEGQLLQVGTPGEIYDYPNCRFTAEFIGETNLRLWAAALNPRLWRPISIASCRSAWCRASAWAGG